MSKSKNIPFMKGVNVVGTIHLPGAFAAAHAAADQLDLVEIRADLLSMHRALKEAPDLPVPYILTVRHPKEGGGGNLSVWERRQRYFALLRDAAFIDIELRAIRELRDVWQAAEQQGVGRMVSWHDFKKTPSGVVLKDFVKRAADSGADVVKIATYLRKPSDLGRLLELFELSRAPRLAVMGMGPLGRVSRLALAAARFGLQLRLALQAAGSRPMAGIGFCAGACGGHRPAGIAALRRRPFQMTAWPARIAEGQLDPSDTERLCGYLMDDSVDVAERASALHALHLRGETPAEVAGCVSVFLREAIDPGINASDFSGPLVDVCGTGGDGRNLFNVSTAVMFVAAGAGACVVKHGNRSITSKCGGADVLEALGISIHVPPGRAALVLQKAGCVFLFAPDYHPAFRKIAPVRKLLAESGQRSVFNILGPLLNPARPTYQLSGVFSPGLLALYAETLGRLGRQRAWAVHGGNGEDEMSLDAPTSVAEWSDGRISQFEVDAAKLGLEASNTASLIGSDARTNAKIIADILSGNCTDARRDMVLLNTAAVLVTCGIVSDLLEGLERARESILSGAAGRALYLLREAAPFAG